jgi:ketosteroid isomerase-like protein
MAAMAIEDRLAIGDLFVRYAIALDDGDVDTVVECFTGDAVLESPVIGQIAGAAAIRAFAERFAAWRKQGIQFPSPDHPISPSRRCRPLCGRLRPPICWW